MKTHAEMFKCYAAEAGLLRDVRAELERLQEEHRTVLASLAEGPRAAEPLSVAEAARRLIEGEALPTSSGGALVEAQSREADVRRRIEGLQSVERSLAERSEYGRVKARQQAIEADPRSKAVTDAWSKAEEAVRAALTLESEQVADLLSGAFGRPEPRHPDWLLVSNLH